MGRGRAFLCPGRAAGLACSLFATAGGALLAGVTHTPRRCKTARQRPSNHHVGQPCLPLFVPLHPTSALLQMSFSTVQSTWAMAMLSLSLSAAASSSQVGARRLQWPHHCGTGCKQGEAGVGLVAAPACDAAHQLPAAARRRVLCCWTCEAGRHSRHAKAQHPGRPHRGVVLDEPHLQAGSRRRIECGCIIEPNSQPRGARPPGASSHTAAQPLPLLRIPLRACLMCCAACAASCVLCTTLVLGPYKPAAYHRSPASAPANNPACAKPPVRSCAAARPPPVPLICCCKLPLP